MSDKNVKTNAEIRFGCVHGVIAELGFEPGMRRLADAGYDGVEMCGNQFVATDDGEPLGKCRPLTAAEVERSIPNFEKAGRVVSDLGLETMAMSFSHFWVGKFELEAMEDYFRLAKAAGAPSLKVAGALIGPRRFDNYWTMLSEAMKQMEIVCGFAEKRQIKALIELHDGYLHESASQARRFCEPFDPKWLGVIHDPENMIRSGKEHWPHGIDILGDYLAYVHWKNMGYVFDEESGKYKKVVASLESGLADWPMMVKALVERGFNGYLVNENYQMKNLSVVEDDLEYMQGILNE